MTDARGHSGATLAAVLFAVALVGYALGVPLGLPRIEAAPQVAAGLALDSSHAAAPFSLLAARLVGYLPLGDAALRANLASALLAALAVTFFGRLGLHLVVSLRRTGTLRQQGQSFAHEPVAVVAAGLALALAVSSFDVATTAGSAAATWCLLGAGLLTGWSLVRDPCSASAGCGLASLAGLAAGVDAVAGPLLWPVLVALAVWALRKRARWPLLAPLAFVAGAGAALLAGVACSAEPVTWSGAFAALGHVAARRVGLGGTVLELVDQLGVVGTLLAAIGVLVLATRAAVGVAWLALTLVSALMFTYPEAGAANPGRAALPVALGIAAVFSAGGLLHVAGRLGRARFAAAVALAVMVVLTPALDGGRSRWLRRSPLPTHLLDHALARAELRSVVDPGTDEMAGLFRLARALGLRPDLLLKPRPAHP